MSFPASSAIQSNCVDETGQGLIQGAVTAVRGIGIGLGPIIFSILFSFFQNSWKSNLQSTDLRCMPFVTATVLATASFVASLFIEIPESPICLFLELKQQDNDNEHVLKQDKILLVN
jgi:MFS family permease